MSDRHLRIYSDASFNCTEKLGAYAFCVEFLGKRAYYSNSFTCKVDSAKDAEILGLGHALNFLLSEDHLKSVDYITVHIDNKKAISEVKSRGTRAGFMTGCLWQALVSKTNPKKSEIVHVKAHTERLGGAYDMNDWCDRHARGRLRELVNATRGVQKPMGRVAKRHKRLPIQVA